MAICRRYEDSERRSNNYFDKLEKLSVYGFAKFNEELAEKRVYSQHNLVSDTSFNEFNLILYRNVLIYFDNDLQKKSL